MFFCYWSNHFEIRHRTDSLDKSGSILRLIADVQFSNRLLFPPNSNVINALEILKQKHKTCSAYKNDPFGF